LADDRELSKTARSLISDGNHQVLVGAAVVWEIAIKSALGRIEVELDDIEAAIPKSGFESLLINVQHGIRAGRLPQVHRDPFDRMLIAQATVEAAIASLRIRRLDGTSTWKRLDQLLPAVLHRFF
jgi:PIN domain nuclease of toxin-antitoxin system